MQDLRDHLQNPEIAIEYRDNVDPIPNFRHAAWHCRSPPAEIPIPAPGHLLYGNLDYRLCLEWMRKEISRML